MLIGGMTKKCLIIVFVAPLKPYRLKLIYQRACDCVLPVSETEDITPKKAQGNKELRLGEKIKFLY